LSRLLATFWSFISALKERWACSRFTSSRLKPARTSVLFRSVSSSAWVFFFLSLK